MSVQSQIDRLTQNVADTYSVLAAKGAAMPTEQTSDQLAATAASIQEGSVLAFPGAGAHNSIYRGAYLGSSVTDEQYAAIAAGTFENLYIGDYWTIGGVNYRIAAFDYYYNVGDSNCTIHHVTLVPDLGMYSTQMNETDSTSGAYANSLMRSQGLSQAKDIIKNAFGEEHILSHRVYLHNASTSGTVTGGSWYDSDVEIMAERNLIGSQVYAEAVGGGVFCNQNSVDLTQFPLFRHKNQLIWIRDGYWLRDVSSGQAFCGVFWQGFVTYVPASRTSGVRPRFSIIG